MNTSFKKLISPLIVSIGKRIERKHFSDKPIIIGACPRSGTTLLLSILDAHNNIYAIQHQSYAFTQWNKTPGSISLKREDRLYREFLLHNIPGNPTRYCEKTPRNIEHFDSILEYFSGGAKLIHIIRDGRDVVTSKHPKLKVNEYYVPVQRWIEDVSFGLKFENDPNVYTVKYEDLVSHFDIEIQKLCAFLGEDVTPEILNWDEHTALKKSKHWANPVKKIHSNAIRKWEKPEHQDIIKEFMANKEAVALLEKLNYL